MGGMIFPIVDRELRVASRRPGTYRSRFLFALAAMLVLFTGTIFSQLPVERQGSLLFISLTICLQIIAGLSGVILAADSIASEKREETLGLLFLTDLKPLDVFAGKVAASCISGFYSLVGAFPILFIPLTLGGISIPVLLMLPLAVISSFVLSVCLGMFVSTVFRDGRKAVFWGLGILLAIYLGPFIGLFVLQVNEVTRLGPDGIQLISSLSPLGFVVWLTAGALPAPLFSSVLVLETSFFLLIWSLLSVFLALRILPRKIRVIETEKDASTERFGYGRPRERQALRRRLLLPNPFVWLASRGIWGRRFLWIVLVSAVLFTFGSSRNRSYFADTYFFQALLYHFVIKIWMITESIQNLHRARRSGALELLLTTPLKFRQMIQGQWRAIHRLFLAPIALLILTESIFLYFHARWMPGDTDVRTVALLFILGPAFLLLDYLALPWFGMADGFRSRTLAQALSRILVKLYVIPAGLFVAASWMASDFLFSQAADHGAVAWIAINLVLVPLFLVRAMIYLGPRLETRLRTEGAAIS